MGLWVGEVGRPRWPALTEGTLSWSMPTGLRFMSFILKSQHQSQASQLTSLSTISHHLQMFQSKFSCVQVYISLWHYRLNVFPFIAYLNSTTAVPLRIQRDCYMSPLSLNMNVSREPLRQMRPIITVLVNCITIKLVSRKNTSSGFAFELALALTTYVFAAHKNGAGWWVSTKQKLGYISTWLKMRQPSRNVANLSKENSITTQNLHERGHDSNFACIAHAYSDFFTRAVWRRFRLVVLESHRMGNK